MKLFSLFRMFVSLRISPDFHTTEAAFAKCPTKAVILQKGTMRYSYSMLIFKNFEKYLVKPFIFSKVASLLGSRPKCNIQRPEKKNQETSILPKFMFVQILTYINIYLLSHLFIQLENKKLLPILLYELVYVTVGNPAVCLFSYLTDVHFRGELQHVGDVSEQKIKCWPIGTREIGGFRL